MRGVKIQVSDPTQRLTLTVQIVFDTSHDQRTAETLRALAKIGPRQPMGSDNAVIKRLFWLVVIHRPAERETHSGDTTLWAAP